MAPAAHDDPQAHGAAARLAGPAMGLLAAALLAMNAYRAVTQSVTHDEALTFLWYLAGPLGGVFRGGEANNHVLHTLLAWCSVRAFGASELTLRLPSLLGGALVLFAGAALCRRLLGRGAWGLFGFALLALNPLLLDFLSAARGYGLAVGLMLLALLLVLRALDASPPAPRRLVGASLAAGLAVSANLCVVPPLAGLAACTALVVCRRTPRGRRGRALLALLAVGAVAAGLLLAGPLSAAPAGTWFLGMQDLAPSLTGLVADSLALHAGAWPLEAHGVALAVACAVLALGGIPVLLAGAAAQATRALAAREVPEHRLAAALAGGMLVSGTLLLAASHVGGGLPWPTDRTGLPYVVLGSLVAARGARAAWETGRRRGSAWRTLGLLPAALLGLVLAQQAAQLQVSRYGVWAHEAGLRRVFDELAARAVPPQAEAGATPVRVACGDWRFEPALEFCRVVARARWMAPVTRDPPQPGGWDWLVTPDPPPPEAGAGEVVFREPLAGTLLVRRAGAP